MRKRVWWWVGPLSVIIHDRDQDRDWDWDWDWEAVSKLGDPNGPRFSFQASF